jgi:membrane associated rhomboid family serine protease
MSAFKRVGFLASLPPVTKNILIINIVVFIIDQVLTKLGIGITGYLALFNFKSQFFNPFQLVSHMFMHGSIAHIFFNMFGVFMFGRVIESVVGSKKFFILYMLSGLGAALLQLTITNFQIQALQNTVLAFNNTPTPDAFWAIIHKYDYAINGNLKAMAQAWYENPDNLQYLEQAKLFLVQLVKFVTDVPLVGASGAVFGVLVAFAMMFPNVELMIIFFPVPIKAKYLIPGYAVLELFQGVAQFRGDNIAHYAHLGGAIVGFFIVRYWKKNQFTIH